MNTAADNVARRTPPAYPHPNEVDCRRIERALAHRLRYRYVAPRVHPEDRGYRIESPCCSRNIDKDGGVIDIARIEYRTGESVWCLYRKDHRSAQWKPYEAFASLAQLLDRLNSDPQRMFWP